MMYCTKEMYGCAYKELIAVLMGFSLQDLEKIPFEKMQFFYDNMDNNYEYEIDYSKPLEEQKMLDLTKAILANLFRDYFASNEERQKIIEKDKKELELLEIEKRKKYNPDNIFKQNTTPKIIENTPVPQHQSLVEVKQGFFAKFINKIKEIFHVK